MRLKKLARYWLPVILWAGFIFYLSSIPNLKTARDPFWDEALRNFLHFLFYFIFCLLWLRALHLVLKTKRYLFSAIFVFFYSVADEFHQHLVPTRSFQVMDLLIDNLGSLWAVFFSLKILPRAPLKIKNLAQRWDFV